MKTIIKTSLIAIALLIGVSANAQKSPVIFGVKAGINLSSVGGDSDGADSKVGFQVGVTMDIPLTQEFYVASGLNFTTKGFKVNGFAYENSYADTKFNPMYLELPIHIGYKLPVAENTKLNFHAGPYIAYGVGGKFSAKVGGHKGDVNVFSTGLLKEFDAGFGLGAGSEFGKIGVGIGYDFGFVNIVDQSGGKLKNQNAYLTLGYKF